jgi:glutathione peroxidase
MDHSQFESINASNMKNILFFFCLVFTLATHAQSAYSLSVKDEEGKDFDVRKFQGKKLLIILLNSIYKSVKKGAEFILISTTEFDSKAFNYFTRERIDSLKLDFPVVGMGKTKKGSLNQSSLFKFLTDKNQNGKFDIDVEVAWQMFALTESGKLYAVMLGSDDIESGRLLDILKAKTN